MPELLDSLSPNIKTLSVKDNETIVDAVKKSPSPGIIILKYFFRVLPLAGIVLLLIQPAAFSTFSVKDPISVTYAIKEIMLAVCFFLIPIFLFHRNIRAYFYILLPIVLLSPLFLFSIVLFELRPRFELIALLMQTNITELSEAVSGYMELFIPIAVAYTLLYLYLVSRNPIKKLPFRSALVISLLATIICFGRIIHEKELYNFQAGGIGLHTLTGVKYYPASLLGGMLEAYTTRLSNQMNIAEDFTFHAINKDIHPKRKIFVFIIGETSRYDRWQINGYERPTSPRLATQENLISYSNVITSSSQTRMAVPLMITRATPDSIDIQFREKSILSAFKEAGYKTAWLSNQTDQEIFWSGAINWHAKTADFSTFSPSQSPNFEFDNYYDERLLPVLDSLINNNEEDLFIVLHTLGNHWDYSKRYPAEFNHFKPSGTTESIRKPAAHNKTAVSNSYDNSILYADYIIDSVINTVKRQNVVSAVTFLSDHGEDLFDAHDSKIDFHLNESPVTLHVPLFIWTSDLYRKNYPEKQQALLEHRHHKIGAEHTFYTLLDLANIGILKNDSTKSIASCAFLESEQKYIDNISRKPLLYSRLLQK